MASEADAIQTANVAMQWRIELTDGANDRLRVEQEGLANVAQLIRGQIARVQAQIAEFRRAGADVGPLVDILKTLERTLGDVEHRTTVVGKALAENLRAPVLQAIEDIRASFDDSFRGLINGTQNLGDALVNIWSGIVDAIARQLSRLAADEVMRLLVGDVADSRSGEVGGLFGSLIQAGRSLFRGPATRRRRYRHAPHVVHGR